MITDRERESPFHLCLQLQLLKVLSFFLPLPPSAMSFIPAVDGWKLAFCGDIEPVLQSSEEDANCHPRDELLGRAAQSVRRSHLRPKKREEKFWSAGRKKEEEEEESLWTNTKMRGWGGKVATSTGEKLISGVDPSKENIFLPSAWRNRSVQLNGLDGKMLPTYSMLNTVKLWYTVQQRKNSISCVNASISLQWKVCHHQGQTHYVHGKNSMHQSSLSRGLFHRNFEWGQDQSQTLAEVSLQLRTERFPLSVKGASNCRSCGEVASFLSRLDLRHCIIITRDTWQLQDFFSWGWNTFPSSSRCVNICPDNWTRRPRFKVKKWTN